LAPDIVRHVAGEPGQADHHRDVRDPMGAWQVTSQPGQAGTKKGLTVPAKSFAKSGQDFGAKGLCFFRDLARKKWPLRGSEDPNPRMLGSAPWRHFVLTNMFVLIGR